jgi:hypothetical protein
VITKRILTILLTLLVAVPVAACGGDDGGGMSAEDYKSEAKKVSATFETDFTAATEALETADTPEANLAGLESMQKALGEGRDSLNKLDPPEEFKQVHDDLAKAIEAAEGDVNEITEAAKANDEAKVEELQGNIDSSFKALGEAGAAYDQKVGI